MRYRILGPLTVTVDGQSIAITAGRDRVVLAMLLLHAGRVLGVGTLADAVWGADPPATARGQLQSCVSRLRRALPAGVIHSDPAGYSLTPGPGELDAAEFTRLVADARAGDDAALYRRALDLWRGDAAAGIDSHGVRLAAAALEQQQVAAVEAWAELELAAGHAGDLIGELSATVDRFPLQERLSGQLMRALHRCGRQADALAEYRRVRSMLREELGLDPGHELQDLHSAILAGSPAEPARPEPAAPVRCLPRTVGDFTGRVGVVRRLVAAIDEAGPGGPVVAVVDGMAGSGKTTLALHLAALVGDRYPDAHLFVDLQGHSAEQPLEPTAALLVLLRQLGVDSERIPDTLIERIGMWRTEVAKRRVLVLFDNAASSAQMADLLPTAPGSLALVTGRRRLLGLDSVHPESLSVLDTDEATILLSRIVGARVWAEPEATAEVVRRCGGLPLAIRLAGARLAHRPQWRVADLVRRLGESVLPELAAEERSVASAFAVSYRQLATPAQRVFRLLGLCPATEFDELTAAALTGLTLPAVRDSLEDFVDVHLVDEPEPGVYRMHDLVREYSAALAAEFPAEERTGALRALLDQQLHAAAAANIPAYRLTLDRDIGTLSPLRPDLLDAVADPRARLEWERPHLGDYVAAAADTPHLIDYAWWLPRAAWRYLFQRGYMDDLSDLHRQAQATLERVANRAALATVLNYQASVHFSRSQLNTAATLLERCVALRREAGDRHALAISMINLAVVESEAGRWEKSIEIALQVRRLSMALNGRDEVNVLANAYQRLGRYPEALRYHRLRLLGQIDFRDGAKTGDTLVNIAVIEYRTGAVGLAVAIRKVRAALRRIQRAGHLYAEAEGWHELAVLMAADGRFDEAIAAHQEALRLSEQMRSGEPESRFCCGLGATLRLTGDDKAARAMFERGLRVAQRFGMPHPIAVSQARLGDCLISDDPDQARVLLERARSALADLGAPELRDVERSLAALGGVDHLHVGALGETMVR
jgi:DNA-binding SARP family transcriptional activator/tetratricopeptide (TPR) repeat protein